MIFSVLNWNIQGTKYITKTKFTKVEPFLIKNDADIFCIQEGQELAFELKKIVKFKSFYSVFSTEDKDGANVIISKFPIVSSGEFNPKLDTGKPLGKIQWANIQIENKILRIYNAHFEIDGVGPKERVELLRFISKDSKNYQNPIIICGDLNTTIPKKGLGRKIVQFFHYETSESLIVDDKYSDKDERYIFNEKVIDEGFHDVLSISKTTWCIDFFHWELFKLKLDWFLVRDIKVNKVIVSKYISDHRSVFVECDIL